MTASAWLICLFGSSRHLPSGPVARRAAGLAQPSSTAYLPAIMVLGLRGRRESVRIAFNFGFLVCQSAISLLSSVPARLRP